MSWGYFNCPRAKIRVNSLVSDYRYYPVHCRQDYLLAEHSLEPLIFRINGYGGIAQYGLRPSGSYCYKIFVIFGQRIANIIQVTLYLFMVYFKVREGGSTAWAPVNNPLPSVD
ncbi:hypothetical protein ES703_111059 [subsurface metagenome]